MPVYLIRAGEIGPVKIGFSENVPLRLAKMQADNHQQLTLLRLFEGGVSEEEKLHEMFKDLRLRGEWFSYSSKMMESLGFLEILTHSNPGSSISVSPDENVGEKLPASLSLRLVLRERKIRYKTVAEWCGTSISCVSDWCTGKRPIPSYSAIILHKKLGIELHVLRPDIFEAACFTDEEAA